MNKIIKVTPFILLLLLIGKSNAGFSQSFFKTQTLPFPTDSCDLVASLPNGDFYLKQSLKLDKYNYKIYVSKYNKCMQLIWQKKIPAKRYIRYCPAGDCSQLLLYQTHISLTKNNDLLVCYTQDKQFIISKWDSLGQIKWSSVLKLPRTFPAQEIISRIDCINIGKTDILFTATRAKDTFPSEYKPLTLLAKFDTDGKLCWSKEFTTNSYYTNQPFIMPVGDRKFFISMETGKDYLFDTSGKVVWVNNFVKGLLNSNDTSSIKRTQAGKVYKNYLYLTGLIYNYKEGYSACISKIDTLGNTIWIKYFKKLPSSVNQLQGIHQINGLEIINDTITLFAVLDSVAGNIIVKAKALAIIKLNLSGEVISSKYAATLNQLGINSRQTIGDGIKLNRISLTDNNGFLIAVPNYLFKINRELKGCNYSKDTSFNLVKITIPKQKPDFLVESNGFTSKDTSIRLINTNFKPKLICYDRQMPMANLGEDTIICYSSSYKLYVGKGNENCSVQWSTGDTGLYCTVTKSGRYWVYSTHGFCVSTDTVNIIFREELKSKLQDKFTCPYDSVLVQSPKVQAANFYWIKPDKSIFKQSNIWVKDTGTYYLMLEGNTNCKNIDTFRLHYYPLPKASAGPDTLLCYNQVYEMQGKGGIAYKWIPAKYLSNDTIPNPLAKAPEQQLYMLIVKNAFGCADTSQMWLKVKPKLEVKLQAETNAVCSGEAVQLLAKASGGDSLHYTYKWQNSTTKDSAFNTILLKSGWLKVTLEDGCSEPASDSIFITVKPTPIAAFYTDPKDTSVAENKIQFINQSQHATNYEWHFGTGAGSNQQNPTYTYTDTGKYFITLIAQNANGCSDTAYGQIYIQEKFRIFIPNTFTPDDDFNNDVFSVYGTGIKEYSYEVYNRWGERIFTSDNTNKQSWNGAIENRGEVVQMDAYFYVVKVKDIENRMHYFNGTINLLR